MSEKVFLISPEAPPHQFGAAGEKRAIKTTGKGIRLGTLDNTKGNADHLLAFVVENIRKVMLVESVVALLRPLEIAVLAKGVENEAAIAVLETCGVSGVQGYAASRPARLAV